MASYKVRDRKNNLVKEIKENKTALFLYGNIFGRLIARILAIRLVSKLGGLYMNSSLSKKMIPNFIEKNHINMDDYLSTEFKNFNDFFIRKIKPQKRPIDKTKTSFISPADSKLIVYKINEDIKFKIKNTYYKVSDLINDDIYKDYLGGYALIFRLCVDDYHRYCYIDDGMHTTPTIIKGELHTVRPVVLEHYNIYKSNSRVWTKLNTKHFNEIIHIEVGALMVGKIHNHYDDYEFKKGEEKGYFLFGGSTVVLLVKKDEIIIDKDIMDASKDNIETIVKYGEIIGIKK